MTRLQYKLWLDSSSSCVPCSKTWPSFTTTILSAWRMVLSRCAITTVVRFCLAMISSSAACTMRSLSLSSADVASSSKSTAGFLMIARAMATRCFWPPDSLPPFRPTSVWYWLARMPEMKPCALAILAASSISAWVAPGRPCAMFSATEPEKSTGSCPTYPSCERSQRTLSVLMSTPSSKTTPSCGS
mmetsp:Transcript_82216/g.163847  ORF Transcript_82216/g.163847 Transcript_82216/m.163847 type:complete len:187 (-) Transcript_82216:1115-1675(-)